MVACNYMGKKAALQTNFVWGNWFFFSADNHILDSLVWIFCLMLPCEVTRERHTTGVCRTHCWTGITIWYRSFEWSHPRAVSTSRNILGWDMKIYHFHADFGKICSISLDSCTLWHFGLNLLEFNCQTLTALHQFILRIIDWWLLWDCVICSVLALLIW